MKPVVHKEYCSCTVADNVEQSFSTRLWAHWHQMLYQPHCTPCHYNKSDSYNTINTFMCEVNKCHFTEKDNKKKNYILRKICQWTYVSLNNNSYCHLQTLWHKEKSWKLWASHKVLRARHPPVGHKVLSYHPILCERGWEGPWSFVCREVRRAGDKCLV